MSNRRLSVPYTITPMTGTTHITAHVNRFTLSLWLPYVSHLNVTFHNHATSFSGPLRTYVASHLLPIPGYKFLDHNYCHHAYFEHHIVTLSHSGNSVDR